MEQKESLQTPSPDLIDMHEGGKGTPIPTLVGKSNKDSLTIVQPVLGYRHMVMHVLNRSEIKQLTTINNTVLIFSNISFFFVGILFSLILTRCSMSELKYNETIMSGLFPWLFGIFILIALIAAAAAYHFFVEKSEILKIIEEETRHDKH